MTRKIGVLRHKQFGHAEDQILLEAERRNLDVHFIDPFTITIGVQPDTIRNQGHSLICDGIISRCEISSGLAPESEAYLRLLQFYENRNIPVINSSESITRCQDKFRTHYYLSHYGIPTPRTFITYEYESVLKLLLDEELTFPIVLKKIYGSRGDGVHKINDLSELKNICDEYFALNEVLFVQEFLDLELNSEGEVKDFRVWVVRDKITGKARTLGAVYRNAVEGNFRTNVAHGGYVAPVENLPKEVAELGRLALDAVAADVAGVDIATTRDGRLYVEEVNISFDTGKKSQEYIGDVWSEVFDLLLFRIESQVKKNAAASLFI